MEILYSREFERCFRRAPKKIRRAFARRLELFLRNPWNPVLRNHVLQGEYANHRSINVTGDWRLIFEELEEGRVIRLKVLGTHGRLYG